MIHPTIRRCIFWTHLGVGIAAGLIILILATTGLLMSFETQIINRAERSLVREKAAGTTAPLSVAEMVAAYDQSGIAGRPTSISYSSETEAPVVFTIGRGNQQLFHPTTGESMGKGAEGIRRFFRVNLSIHRWLTWPAQQPEPTPGATAARNGETPSRGTSWRDVGGQITAAATLGFLFLLVSGLVIWLPKKRAWKAFKAVLTLQPRLKGRARDWNWHNVAGIWASPFILITCLTGLIMAYPWANKALFAAFGETPPQRQEGGAPRGAPAREKEGRPRGEGEGQANRTAPTDGAERPSRSPRPQGQNSGPGSRGGRPEMATGPLIPTGLDELAALAKKQMPNWKTVTLDLRSNDQQPLVASITDAGRGRPDRKQKFTVDPATFEILKTETFSDLKPGAQSRQIVRWLHTGEFGGGFGQLLAALSAAAIVVLTWTGFALSFRRFFLKRKVTSKPA
jgi:uncharacterized iron-regulated membrane protein